MNWNKFGILLIWAFVGFIYHVLLKLMSAYRRPDFKFSIFIHRNWIPFLTSFWAIIIVVGLSCTNEVLLAKIDNFEAVFVGYSGSSFLKNLLKKRETKTNT